MTHNAAIAHLIATGNEVEAFAIALQDEGIDQSVTLAQWVGFAHRCIANRAAEAAAYSNYVYA